MSQPATDANGASGAAGVNEDSAAAAVPYDRAGYWLVSKPQHGWTCDCPETDQHEERREWVPYDFDLNDANA